MLIGALWILTACGHRDCVTVPVGPRGQPADWKREDVRGDDRGLDVYCFCAGDGSVGECWVSDHAACDASRFDEAFTRETPVVLGDVTLTPEQEEDLREACEKGGS